MTHAYAEKFNSRKFVRFYILLNIKFLLNSHFLTFFVTWQPKTCCKGFAMYSFELKKWYAAYVRCQFRV